MRTDAEISPAIVSGIVTGDAPFSYWPIFSLSQEKVSEFPEVPVISSLSLRKNITMGFC